MYYFKQSIGDLNSMICTINFVSIKPIPKFKITTASNDDVKINTRGAK